MMMLALSAQELHEIADRDEPSAPHLCGQGIAMGSHGLQPGQLLGVNQARKLGAQLLLVADEYETLEARLRGDRP